MNSQINIEFNRKKARERRDEGMERAERHANAVHDQWSQQALDFLKGYAERNHKFMIEDVRFASQGVVPLPPTSRSWGSIAVKAKRLGWIEGRKGEIEKVRNVNAHSANAQVWRSLICKR